MYSKWIFKKCEDELEIIDVRVNGRRIDHDRYARGTVLIADNIEDLRHAGGDQPEKCGVQVEDKYKQSQIYMGLKNKTLSNYERE